MFIHSLSGKASHGTTVAGAHVGTTPFGHSTFAKQLALSILVPTSHFLLSTRTQSAVIPLTISLMSVGHLNVLFLTSKALLHDIVLVGSY